MRAPPLQFGKRKGVSSLHPTIRQTSIRRSGEFVPQALHLRHNTEQWKQDDNNSFQAGKRIRDRYYCYQRLLKEEPKTDSVVLFQG
jgi:hypothetical protein